jgi:hypothetical protein
MSRRIALGALLLVVLGSGALAGLWSGRWGNSQALDRAVARLGQVPPSLGTSWDVKEDTMSERELAVAEVSGYLHRQYTHRRTGTRISVLLVCGRPGPISVHTPEVCYAGAGYVQTSREKTRQGPADMLCQFQVRDFRHGNVARPTLLRIFMSWGCEGEWRIPARPRWAFAGKPYLYKLYVVRQMARPDEPVEKDPALDLMKELMPQLQETLFPGT